MKNLRALVLVLAIGALGTVLMAPAGAAESHPAGRIAYVWANFAFTEEEIATIRADGSRQQKLTNEEGIIDVSPAWSPDGRRIAFTSTVACHRDIRVSRGSTPSCM